MNGIPAMTYPEINLLAQAKKNLPLSKMMARLGCGDRARKSARCPFHDDSSASFSVFIGDDGYERWKCHAGCGQGDAVDFLAKHQGLNNGDACREYIRLAGVAPSSGPQLPANPCPSSPARFNWSEFVAKVSDKHRRNLAQWRGYDPSFVEWLHNQNYVGLFDGDRIAFPVHDSLGAVTGCHYRIEDGSWRYYPTGTRVAPFIIGNLASAKAVFVFESQWDLLAIFARLKHHVQPLADTAAIATRGASNGRLVAGLCPRGAIVYAFTQNDDAGQTWLGAIAAQCGCRCLNVATPPPHKDPNEWTRAGAPLSDIQLAISQARLVPPSVVRPDLHETPVPDNPRFESSSSENEAETAPAEFPVDALPPSMANFVADVAQCTRVPMALPAVCALGVASAALGAGLEVLSGPDRVTRGNLFLLASADSGSGKSETFRLVAAPIIDYQEKLFKTWKEQTEPKFKTQLLVLNKEIANLQRKAAKTIASEQEKVMAELEYKVAQRGLLYCEMAMPCVIAQDVTTERLAVLLLENRERLFSASADARKVIENVMGRYNPGKTTDESLYLCAYSADLVRVDRQGREPVVLHKPCLCLCWFIQPDLLGTMLDEESLSVSGFLPRLLVCHTRAVVQKIEGSPKALFEQARSQWVECIVNLLASYHDAQKPHRFEPTPEAQGYLDDFHNQIVDRRSGDLADVGAFAARYAENAWRLAVVFHALLNGSEAHLHALPLETARNAVRVMEWFIAQQLDILTKGRLAAAVKLEDQVLELLESLRERKSLDHITARDVHRARITPMADAAKALLGRMERDGLLVSQDITPPHGGKTTTIYRRVKNPAPE
jgi:replicative DNA helicase